MTDHEKLFRLLLKAFSLDSTIGLDWGECSLFFPKVKFKEAIDYLLENGVTVRQMQKPLTVEELKEIYFMREDHVWPRERKPPYLYLDSSLEKNDHLWVAWSIVVDFLETGYRQYTVESYGKTWRCWAEKPTDEERKAAEWL